MIRRRLPGRKFLAIMVIGFGVIIAVNITMATFATQTFPGLIVENSYVASQEYNKGLEAGRRQKQMGWQVQSDVAGEALVVEARNAAGEMLHGARVRALLTHPLGRTEPVQVELREGPDGRFRAPHTLPPGRWDMELTIHRNGQDWWAQRRITVE